MVVDIIRTLKKRIRIMWVIIGALVALLAVSSAYNVCNYFERTEAHYTVPENQKTLYFPQAAKKLKKVK